MRKIRSYKRKRWISAGIVLLILISVIGVLGMILEYHALKTCRKELGLLKEQMCSYQKLVYVAAEKLQKGTILTEENVYLTTKVTELPLEEYITQESFGMTLIRDVAEGTWITNDMMCSEDGNKREIFISDIDIPEYMQNGDRIDVRIRYQNAEDYVVLTDKILLKCEPGKGMVIKVTEEEILLLSSAISDGEKYSGTKLYSVKYPEYENTEKGIVTYVANHEILALLRREKTEGESRTALEKRLMQNQKR